MGCITSKINQEEEIDNYYQYIEDSNILINTSFNELLNNYKNVEYQYNTLMNNYKCLYEHLLYMKKEAKSHKGLESNLDHLLLKCHQLNNKNFELMSELECKNKSKNNKMSTEYEDYISMESIII